MTGTSIERRMTELEQTVRELQQAMSLRELAPDWLEQVVQLRIKKFGADLPTEAKEKARQFRFLQYRGFDLDICRQALAWQADDE